MSLKFVGSIFFCWGWEGVCFAVIGWLFGAEFALLYLLKGHKISEGIFQRAKLTISHSFLGKVI